MNRWAGGVEEAEVEEDMVNSWRKDRAIGGIGRFAEGGILKKQKG